MMALSASVNEVYLGAVVTGKVIVMGSNDHVDSDLSELLAALLDEGYLLDDTSESGIAKQVIAQGEDSMSPAQRYVYDTKILPAMRAYGGAQERRHVRDMLSDDD